ARRPVRAGVVPQLPGRDRRVVRLGAADLLGGRTGVRAVDRRQPAAAGAVAPSLLPREVSRLPAGAQGAFAVPFVTLAAEPPPGTKPSQSSRSGCGPAASARPAAMS